MTSLRGPSTSARSDAPRATASTGRRGVLVLPTEDDARVMPQRSAVRVIEVEATSCSPASALMSRSVLVSAMPGRTTVVPKSERKPSAAAPPAIPCLGEVLQARQHEQTLPAALAHHGGQIGHGGDIGHLIEGEQGGRRRPAFLCAV